MALKVSDTFNTHEVFVFVENASISNMLENGTMENPLLVPTFEFVEKASVHLKI